MALTALISLGWFPERVSSISAAAHAHPLGALTCVELPVPVVGASAMALPLHLSCLHMNILNAQLLSHAGVTYYSLQPVVP